jgi:hypothetical protein
MTSKNYSILYRSAMILERLILRIFLVAARVTVFCMGQLVKSVRDPLMSVIPKASAWQMSHT